MASLRNYKPLRLMAADKDDLDVVSSCLQDALLKLGDISYQPKQRRFAFVSNRFIWEAAGKRGPFGRVRCGVHFDDVVNVSRLNVRDDAKEALVAVLAIRWVAGEDGAGSVYFDLAGGGAIKLDVEAINIQLADISDPWLTQSKPKHEA